MSTNERDELAELAESIRSGSLGTSEIVAAILAAGYSKPRTITTAEELDALPDGSVVLYHGRSFQRFAPQPAPFDEYRKWQCADGGFVRSTKDGRSILPATVLYAPEPQP